MNKSSIFQAESQAVGSGGLENNRINAATSENTDSLEAKYTLRSDLHKLRAVASKIAVNHSVRICDHYTHDGQEVTVYQRIDKKMTYKNLIHCGSVWACPVCRWKIQTARRDEIKLLNLYAENAGYYMGWLTLTVSHHQCSTEKAKEQTKEINEVWRKIVSIRKFKQLAAEIDFQYIKILEIMYGIANGYHPHTHTIVYGLNREKLQEICDIIRNEWVKRFKGSTLQNQVYKPVFNSTCINNELEVYVTKYNIMHESTNAKIQKKGYTEDHINPLNTLELLKEKEYRQYNEDELIKIYNSYLIITKRVRSITFSRGLKEKFGIKEVSDLEILNDTSKLKTKMITILESVWKIMVVKELRGELLNRFEYAWENELNYKGFVKWVAEKVGYSVVYDMECRLYIAGIDIKTQMSKRTEVYKRKKENQVFKTGKLINKQLFKLNDESMNRIIIYKDVANLLQYSYGHSKRLLGQVRAAKNKKRITLQEFLEFHQIEITV